MLWALFLHVLRRNLSYLSCTLSLCSTKVRTKVASAPISLIFGNHEKVTFDLVSLVIVLASCLWTSSLSQRYCYGGLIVTCHKSSFDQLIFTYCKRLTQLSKQFFTVVLLFLSSFFGSPSFTVCLLPSLPLHLSLFYNFCVSSLLFYTFFIRFMSACK